MMTGLLVISLTGIVTAQTNCKKRFNDCYDRLLVTNDQLKIARENIKILQKRERNENIKWFAIGAGAGVAISFTGFLILFHR